MDPNRPSAADYLLPQPKPLSPEGEKALAHVGDLPPDQQEAVVERLLRGLFVRPVPLPGDFVAPQTPVLRALKQEIYDTIRVPEYGLGCTDRAFADCKWFPDHTRKTEADCNLRQDGMLGYPVEYDLTAVELRVEKFCHADDVARILRAVTLKWHFGQQGRPWRLVAGSAMTPVLRLPGDGEKDANLRAHVERQLKEFAARGAWLAYGADMRDPEGRPRRIGATEFFGCDVDAPLGLGELHGPVRLKVVMQDTIYATV